MKAKQQAKANNSDPDNRPPSRDTIERANKCVAECLEETKYLIRFPALRLAIILHRVALYQYLSPTNVWQLLELVRDAICRPITLGQGGAKIYLRPSFNNEPCDTIHPKNKLFYYHGDEARRCWLTQQDHFPNNKIEDVKYCISSIVEIQLRGQVDDLKWGRELLNELDHPCQVALASSMTMRAAHIAVMCLPDLVRGGHHHLRPLRLNVSEGGVLVAFGDARGLFEIGLCADILSTAVHKIENCRNMTCRTLVVHIKKKEYCSKSCTQQSINQERQGDADETYKHTALVWKQSKKKEKKSWQLTAAELIKWSKHHKEIREKRNKEQSTLTLQMLGVHLHIAGSEIAALAAEDKILAAHRPAVIVDVVKRVPCPVHDIPTPPPPTFPGKRQLSKADIMRIAEYNSPMCTCYLNPRLLALMRAKKK